MQISVAVVSLLVASASASNCKPGHHAWQTDSGCSEFNDLDGYHGTSALCAMLTWTDDADACPTFDTSADAEEFCADKGLKLCSVTEIETLTDEGSLTNTILSNTCSLKDNNVFTSTPCEGDGSGNNVITMTGQGSNKNCRGVDNASGSERRAMCCGRSGPKCHTCPRGTSSPKKAEYLRQCAAGPRMHRVFPAGVYDDFTVDYDAAEFRACPAGLYASGSAVSCPVGIADLDWDIAVGKDKWPADTKSTAQWWKKSASSSVCAKTHSMIDGVYCGKYKNSKKSWAEATSICMANGARLCTVTELENDETSGTGCNYNWKPVWSDTPCVLNDDGDLGFIVTSGEKKFQKTIGKKCRDPATWTEAVTRCCADDLDPADDYPMCKACPDGFTSLPGAALASECVPAAPFTCNDGSEYLAGSWATCDTLSSSNMFRDTGLTNDDGAAVCAGGKNNLGKCSNKKKKLVQHDAAAECESEGARLCTWDEIKFGAGAVSECYSQRTKVWTSTMTTSGKYVIAQLSGSDYEESKTSSSKAKVFCCADGSSDNNDANAGHYCAACPSNNNGALFGGQAQNVGVYQCSPDAGFSAVYPITGAELRFSEPETPDGATSCGRDEYKSHSGATCGELGINAARSASDEVCAKAVKVPRNTRGSKKKKCAGQMTFAEAGAACSDSGMRMCTAAELYDGEANAGVGCGLDSKLVWSATGCDISGDAFVMRSAGKGESNAFSEVQCGLVSTDLAHAVCCADTEVHCKDCPANSATALGSNSGGAESCLCDDPFAYGPNGCASKIVFVRIPGSVSRAVVSDSTSFQINPATTTLGELRLLVSQWRTIAMDTMVLTFEGTELIGNAQGDSIELSNFGIDHMDTVLVTMSCEAYKLNNEPYFDQKYACDNTPECGARKYLSGSTKSCSTLGIDVKIKQAYVSPVTGGVVGGGLINRQSSDYFCGTAYDHDPANPGCMPEAMTFFEAKNYCEAKGMRTCGTQEIITNIPNDAASRANGCWADERLEDDVKIFWSHKPCQEDAAAVPTLPFADRRQEPYANRRIRFYAQATGNNVVEEPSVSAQSKCLPGHDDATETAQVACCADDTPVDTQFCRECPAHSCADHTCPTNVASNVDCVCDEAYAQYDFFNETIDRVPGVISRPVCNNPMSESPTSAAPSAAPSVAPTSSPSSEPTTEPTSAPSTDPTVAPTDAPTPTSVEEGIYVCDHIHGGPGCTGPNRYFISSTGTPNDGLNFGSTKCYRAGGNDLLSKINEKISAQYGVTADREQMLLTHDEHASGPDATYGVNSERSTNADINCNGNSVGSFGIANGHTLHLWPWTFCPENTFRWGSRLPCDVDKIPWLVQGNNQQTNPDWGPFGWNNGNKACKGWSMSGTDLYAQQSNADKSALSAAYRSPTGSEICVAAVENCEPTTCSVNKQCSGRLTWSDAKEFCYNMGARLCTQEELQLSCVERTGCDYDYAFIWGKDECTATTTGGTFSGHIASAGDQRKWWYRNLKHDGAPKDGAGTDFYMGGGGSCVASGCPTLMTCPSRRSTALTHISTGRLGQTGTLRPGTTSRSPRQLLTTACLTTTPPTLGLSATRTSTAMCTTHRTVLAPDSRTISSSTRPVEMITGAMRATAEEEATGL